MVVILRYMASCVVEVFCIDVMVLNENNWIFLSFFPNVRVNQMSDSIKDKVLRLLSLVKHSYFKDFH